MAARILLEAMTNGGAAGLAAVAHRVGLSKGRASLAAALEEAGYVPERGADDEIKFRNCPFHALVAEDRETTCGMNLEFVRGIIEGSGQSGPALLQPEPGYCCVRIAPDPAAAGGHHLPR